MSISLEDIQAWLKKELNFFRIHLLFFLFVPLVTAIIFWAVNGQFHIGEFIISSLAKLESQTCCITKLSLIASSFATPP